mmetsp:Transcript_42352/g.76869  ORF Transcript_42352/g.76869 Transcript_42352/m.76869 type:complete len:469 (-) Transcript_42352:62-1468(-)
MRRHHLQCALSVSLGILYESLADAASEPRLGAASCLGSLDCYSFIESLPQAPYAAALSHLSLSRATAEQVETFFGDPAACEMGEAHHPLSLDAEVMSLASSASVHTYNFPTSASQVETVQRVCASVHELARRALEAAVASGSVCGNSVASLFGSRFCERQHVASELAIMRRSWASGAALGCATLEPSIGGAAGNSHTFAMHLAQLRNNVTGPLMAGACGQVETVLAAASDDLHGNLLATVDGVLLDEGLAELATSLTRSARFLVEHASTALAVKNTLLEVEGVFPGIQGQVPPIHFHQSIYGRHWDVLEALLVEISKKVAARSPAKGPRLRMLEVGVAQGAIGLFLLPRFPELQYVGVDPTIRDSVVEAYLPYSDRAQLQPMMSDELFNLMSEQEKFDLIFVDGPHTYKNVKQDIQLWHQHVRSGGVLAGHDFTCAHPPLLWAVLEQSIETQQPALNVGHDGVWWWHV